MDLQLIQLLKGMCDADDWKYIKMAPEVANIRAAFFNLNISLKLIIILTLSVSLFQLIFFTDWES